MPRRSFLRVTTAPFRGSVPFPATWDCRRSKTSANIPVVAAPSGTKTPVPTLARTRYQKPATIGVLRLEGEPCATHESATSRHVIRFGAFESDLRAGDLINDRLKIDLQQQPFQVLAPSHIAEVRVISRSPWWFDICAPERLVALRSSGILL